MTEWYRRKTWTKADQEEFFAKLQRARKDGRAQYLKIQAIELVETRDLNLLTIAEGLLIKMLEEYPEDNFNKAGALHTLGDIYQFRGQLTEAIEYYQQALDHETVYPNVQTQAYLDYSEMVIRSNRTDLYKGVEELLTSKLTELLFPVAKYKVYMILAIVNFYYNRVEEAKRLAEKAKLYAGKVDSGLRYHKQLGLVKDADRWLEKLLR